MTELELSQAIEGIMVARNLRHMKTARAALEPGYFLRAASYLRNLDGTVIIGTGFPVNNTFETDGPVGAIALYDALEETGATPWLACGTPLFKALSDDYRVIKLYKKDRAEAQRQTLRNFRDLKPLAIVSIERPGVTDDGCYYNMRGEDISSRCAIFDSYLELAECPTVAIGDGGNEIGMGNIRSAIAGLDINASVTECDELLVADVSNWGAYGLIAFLDFWSGKNLLEQISPLSILEYLSAKDSVDGVSRENTLTEDGLEATEGLSVIAELIELVAKAKNG